MLAETSGENEIATDIELKIIRRHNRKLREVDDDTTSTTVSDYIIYLKYIRKKVHIFNKNQQLEVPLRASIQPIAFNAP